jgi:hypothetical protein
MEKDLVDFQGKLAEFEVGLHDLALKLMFEYLFSRKSRHYKRPLMNEKNASRNYVFRKTRSKMRSLPSFVNKFV